MKSTTTTLNVLTLFAWAAGSASAFSLVEHPTVSTTRTTTTLLHAHAPSSRRQVLQQALLASVATTALVQPAWADAAAIQDSLDIENFLRTGADSGGNMGVSSQAGKSRPQTGVIFRDGSDVNQDRTTGAVSAELLTGTKENPRLVLASFESPKYRLEKGPVFDVECRDSKTGDGVFLAVTKKVPSDAQKLADLPNSFFLERLFDPTGRFSFYGPPTDIKVKKRVPLSNDRVQLELSFSNLSQSTNAEIPRKALLVATLPPGTDNAVMLVGSATATRWNKQGADAVIQQTMESFRAIPAPKSNLKLRAKDRTNGQY
eukprot:CAMPEP_0172448190 /NCGR_PEP_ID=MMETSP1065-20121228/7251_1 /TAXON_ID=265537 /ORGANISM="Amphiprora paludosa, Strain CCMP125" /LENGTH=315 /DNA_ID=CAMNT_0013199609 /DNA_START=52 /DNA_END=996 /DNA_ORIENTATION=+